MPERKDLRNYKDSKHGFTLTGFMCRLVSMSTEELRKARPEHAAKYYGIREDWAAAYIIQQQTIRGIQDRLVYNGGPNEEAAPR